MGNNFGIGTANKILTFKYGTLSLLVNPNKAVSCFYFNIPLVNYYDNNPFGLSLFIDGKTKELYRSDYKKIIQDKTMKFQIEEFDGRTFSYDFNEYNKKSGLRLINKSGSSIEPCKLGNYDGSIQVWYNHLDNRSFSNYPLRIINNNKTTYVEINNNNIKYSLDDEELEIISNGNITTYMYRKDNVNKTLLEVSKSDNQFTIKRFDTYNKCIENYTIEYFNDEINITNSFDNKMMHLELFNTNLKKIQKRYNNNSSIILNDIEFSYESGSNDVRIITNEIRENGTLKLKKHYIDVIYDKLNYPVYEIDDEGNYKYYRYDINLDKVIETSSLFNYKLEAIKEFNYPTLISKITETIQENTSLFLKDHYKNERRYSVSQNSYGMIKYHYDLNNSLGSRAYTFGLFIKVDSVGTDISISIRTNNKTNRKYLNNSCVGKYQLLLVTIQDDKEFNYVEFVIESERTNFSICSASLFEGGFVSETKYDNEGFVVEEKCGEVKNKYYYNDQKIIIKKVIAGEISRTVSYNENNYVAVNENDNVITKYEYSEDYKNINKVKTVGLLSAGYLIKESHHQNKKIDYSFDENGYKFLYGYDEKNEINSSTNDNSVTLSIDVSSNKQKDYITYRKSNESINKAISYNENNDAANFEQDSTKRYDFNYDKYKNIQSIYLDNKLLESYEYDYYLDAIKKIKYSDNSYKEYSCDEEGKIKEVSFSNGEIYNFNYDSFDRLISITDKIGIAKLECIYNKDKIKEVYENGLRKKYYQYDNGNNVSSYDSIIIEKNNINTNTSKYYFCDFDISYIFNGDVPKSEVGDTIEGRKTSDKPSIITISNDICNIKALSVNNSKLRYNISSKENGTVGVIYYRNSSKNNTLFSIASFDAEKKLCDYLKVEIKDGSILAGYSTSSNVQNIYSCNAPSTNEYNLIGLSWEKNENGKYNLYLHRNETLVLLVKNFTLSSSFGGLMYLYLGSNGYYSSEGNDGIYFKNLFISKNSRLEEGIINCVLQKINNQLTGVKEKNYAYVESDILIENNSNFDIYPLHNDFNSLNGNEPVIYEPLKVKKDGLDESFQFEEISSKKLYYACGQKLAYRFNLLNRGTIMMNVLFNYELDRKQVIFETCLNDGTKFSLCRKGTQLTLEINGIQTESLGCINVLEKNVVGLSYYYEDDEDGYTKIPYTYFRLYLNGNVSSFYGKIGNFASSTAITYIGREKDDISTKLNGYIEMMCIKNSISEVSTLNDVLEKTIYGYEMSKGYDEFGRITDVKINHINNTILKNTYTYKNNIHDSKASSMLVHNEGVSIDGRLNVRSYTYNRSMQVDWIKDNTFGDRTYNYDYRGFLISEVIGDNLLYRYKYDNNGNLISITRIDSSKSNKSISKGFVINPQGAVLPPIIEEETTVTTFLEYSTVVKDLLTKIDNKTISYNGLYPSVYKDNELSWSCGRLIKYGNYTLEYNHNDLLVSVKEGTSEIKHLYYDGDKLIKEVDKSFAYPIYYLYDSSNVLYGLKYNNRVYFYVRDVLQNILGIVDSNGKLVVKYSCTAFGEEISCTDNSGISLGKINKFRYKGYYYENNIGLFYLKSRFYDSTIGRFISPDSTEYIDPTSINGLNIFSYCYNDPMDYVDYNGHIAIELTVGLSILCILVIGIVFLSTTAVVYSLHNKSSNSISFELPHEWENAINSLRYNLENIAFSKDFSIESTNVEALFTNSMTYERKIAAPRIKCKSKKEAKQKAFLKGGKRKPLHHTNGKYGNHYHPNNPKFSHWHYYYLYFFYSHWEQLDEDEEDYDERKKRFDFDVC